MKVLITGSNGFIGKNLVCHIKYNTKYEILTFNRGDKLIDLKKRINKSDIIIHLAGENRPKDEKLFLKINSDLTKKLCQYVIQCNKKIPILFSSSIKAKEDSLYGKSKLSAESILKNLNVTNKNPIYIFRLSNIFGKWSKPNYNSVVSTFCYNIANNLPIKINDEKKTLNLSHVDDVVSNFIKILRHKNHKEIVSWPKIKPNYDISLNDLSQMILNYKTLRDKGFINNVGKGFNRVLYSTFMSYIPPKKFSIKIPKNEDNRGLFVEMLKTEDSGQFSFFTSMPGVIRGEHFHNTKTEKFLIVKGEAKFLFRSLLTDEIIEILTSEKNLKIIDTIPGWVHSVENIGNNILIGIIWANEIFDKNKSDTIIMKA